MAAVLGRHANCVRQILHSNKTLKTWLSAQRSEVRCLHNLKTTRGQHGSTGQITLLSQHSLGNKSQFVLDWRSSVVAVRWKSSDTTSSSSPVTPPTDTASQATSYPEGYIPEPPSVPQAVPQVDLELPEVTLNALGEPTLQSLGLAHWTPSGIVQWGLENLHVGLDIPWWTAIVIGTVCLRIAIFPLVIFSQRNAANMHNHMPTVQRLQERFTKSRMSGNPIEAARAANELMDYMKRNNVRPGRSMMVPFAQMPIFISVFVGVRQMANLPVDSMKTGGLLWFTDLTVPDPFWAMPIITMATFLMTIELGVDGVKAGSMGHNMKWVMRIMPLVICPMIINFPAAMLCYWFTSNAFSLVQVLFLKIPAVRQFFGIPIMIKHQQTQGPQQKKFMEGFKETWSNSKLMAQVEDRRRMDATRFKEAGQGPLVKTYPYDPTKVKDKAAAGSVSAKAKSS